jgi:hypothetical protein
MLPLVNTIGAASDARANDDGPWRLGSTPSSVSVALVAMLASAGVATAEPSVAARDVSARDAADAEIVGAAPAASTTRDGYILDLGLGSPGGVTIGLGVDSGRWRAVGEVGGVVLGVAGALSIGARVHRDVVAWPRTAVSAGVTASSLWYLIAGDFIATGRLLGIGPTAQLRRAVTGRTELGVDAGAVVGRCDGDCDGVRRYVELVLGGRILIRL